LHEGEFPVVGEGNSSDARLDLLLFKRKNCLILQGVQALF
jgi:hypothetical protein